MVGRFEIEIENQIAHKMLIEASQNEEIKQVLEELGLVLLEHVLHPLQVKVEEISHFSALSTPYQLCLRNLIDEHSQKKRQCGAMLPNAKPNEIIQSKEKLRDFLALQENWIRKIKSLDKVDEIIIVIKIMAELANIYYRAPKNYHSNQFEAILAMMGPTEEEIDIRLTREELQEVPKLALTRGIGTAIRDLGLLSENHGFLSGKAVFGKVSMAARLAYIVENYDKEPTASLAEKMHYYQIPINPQERRPLAFYANKWKTVFEKMTYHPEKNSNSPLIASVSGSSARSFISLQDLNAFKGMNGKFDMNKAQIFANCILAFMVHAGHHSFIEVAEVWNRIVIYEVLKLIEESKNTLTFEEKELPFYLIGDYASFFHKSYAEKVVPIAEKNNFKM